MSYDEGEDDLDGELLDEIFPDSSINKPVVQMKGRQNDMSFIELADRYFERLAELYSETSIENDYFLDLHKYMFDLLAKTFVIPNETQEGSS